MSNELILKPEHIALSDYKYSIAYQADNGDTLRAANIQKDTVIETLADFIEDTTGYTVPKDRHIHLIAGAPDLHTLMESINYVLRDEVDYDAHITHELFLNTNRQLTLAIAAAFECHPNFELEIIIHD